MKTQTGQGPRGLSRGGAAIALSVLMLSGCVSAKSDGQDAAAVLDSAALASEKQPAGTMPQSATAAVGQAAQPGYVDPRMVSAASARSSAQNTQGIPAQQGQASDNAAGAPKSGYAMQPTGIAAGSQSIFSNGAAGAAPSEMDSVPAYAPTGRIIPALKSVYSPTSPHAPVEQPQPKPAQEHSSNTPDTSSGVSNDNALANSTSSPAQPNPYVPQNNIPMAAALFAGVPKKRNGIDPTGKVTPPSYDESHADEDDKPTGLMKLASMSGMTRVAPNGLVLQTNQVDVGCLKPELVHRIKQLETHYGKRAIITSGYRPPKGATHGSKHYTCEAVDIQINGVSKWDLAEYLRSVPGRGGVGTYCHTESVHMDIGETRDWNWPCRRSGTNS